MTTRLTIAGRNAALAAVAALVNAGSGPALLKIRSGTRPTNVGDTPTGTLLATFTLSDPAYAAPSGGSAAIDVTPALTTTGLAAGDAGWFLVEDSDGTPVFDGTVAVTGGDLDFNTVTVSVGLTLTITTGSLTVPVS